MGQVHPTCTGSPNFDTFGGTLRLCPYQSILKGQGGVGHERGGLDNGGFDKGGKERGGFGSGGAERGGADNGGADSGGFDSGGFDSGGLSKEGGDRVILELAGVCEGVGDAVEERNCEVEGMVGDE